MSKNEKICETHMTTKTLTYCALLAALQVAMARLFGLMPTAFARFSIEAVPTVIAGILFGPVAGGLVGFVADFVGCLFSGYGYNPIFCVPPILYGVCGGLFRPLLAKKLNIWTLFLTMLPPVVLGSVLWQSFALGYVYKKGFWFFFSTRSVQFAITIVVEVIILQVLFETKVFNRIGVWSPKNQTVGEEKHTVKSILRNIAKTIGAVLIALQIILVVVTIATGGSLVAQGLERATSLEHAFLNFVAIISPYASGILGAILLLVAHKEKKHDS